MEIPTPIARVLTLEELLLDPENPRLVVPKDPSQATLARALYETEALDELVNSFLDNGYFQEEPLVVVPSGDRWIAVEGNRRLATLKLLSDEKLRLEVGVEGWPKPNRVQAARLASIPCIEYKERAQVLPFLGFRHITGAKKWGPFQKARFISQLIDAGQTPEDIERLIGDSSSTVKKLYQDYVMYQQVVRDVDVDESSIRERFSLLEVTLGSKSIKKYLGAPAALPRERVVDIVPASKVDELTDVVGWIFGTRETSPIISDSRQISKQLAPVLSNPQATEHLKKTRDLEAAYQYSGDEREFLLKRSDAAERALRDVASLLPLYVSDREVQLAVSRLKTFIDSLHRQVDSK